ncbi:MAG: hypothetical protein RLN70_05195, partial [Rhodospirillaceae bacterium]
WRALVNVLRPGGLMVVGLYSTTARQGVAAARQYVAKRNYKPDLSGIRRFRKDVLDATRPPRSTLDENARDLRDLKIAELTDFYSSSTCRDLIFHVQERGYSLHELPGIIEALGLRLLSLRIPSKQTLKKFRQQYPEPADAGKLDNWAAFERENPNTFAGMYNFVVQKPVS